MSVSDWVNISAPYDADGKYDRCRIFEVDYNIIQQRPNETTPTIACETWDFAQTPFQVHFRKTSVLYCFLLTEKNSKKYFRESNLKMFD